MRCKNSSSCLVKLQVLIGPVFLHPGWSGCDMTDQGIRVRMQGHMRSSNVLCQAVIAGDSIRRNDLRGMFYFGCTCVIPFCMWIYGIWMYLAPGSHSRRPRNLFSMWRQLWWNSSHGPSLFRHGHLTSFDGGIYIDNTYRPQDIR